MSIPVDSTTRARPARAMAAAYLLVHLGAVGLGLWVVGDISDQPYDSPDAGSVLGLRLPASLYGDGAGTVVTGLVGLAVVVVAVVLARASARHLGRSGARWLWGAVAWSGLVGFAVGAALRVVLALTWDANIGGGLLLVFGLPLLGLAWLAGVVPLVLAGRAGRPRG